jgi:hypothetical protein
MQLKLPKRLNEAPLAERESSRALLEQNPLVVKPLSFSSEKIEPFRVLYQRWRV